jgi:Bacterial Ig-like domain
MLIARANDGSMKRSLFIIAYCLLVLLSACQDSSPAPTPPTPSDTTPPTVMSQTPLANAENVAPDAEISVTFSEAMLASSITNDTLKLTDSSGTVVERTATLNDETLTVQLSQILTVPTKLRLELNGLTDLAGNQLATTAWSWFVPASNYGNPELLGNPNPVTDARLEERPVQMASDADGNIVVAWLNGGNLFVKSWNGTAWQQLPALDKTQPIYAPIIKLFNAQPIVAFQEGRKLKDDQVEPNGNILVYRWTGDAWESLGEVDIPERDAAAPSLAVANDGTLTIAYFEFESPSSNVVVKRYDGSGWQSLGDALDVSPERSAVFPSLALDTDGNPTVAWYEDRAGDLARNIYVKRWNGVTWEQLGVSLNSDPKERADTLSLAIGGNGQAVVAFSEYNETGKSNNVYVKHWNGTAWEQLGTVVDNIESQRAVYPSVAVDAANKISVAWYEAVCQSVSPCNENDSVYLARWDGVAWQQLGIQDADAKREAYYPSVALGSNGAPVLVWIEGKTLQYQIFVKRYSSIP